MLDETECGDDKEEGWEYVEGENTTFTCSVEYAGRWPPSLSWSQQTNNNDSSSQSDNDIVNSSFTIQLSASHHGDRFTCLTHFDEMDDVNELEADNVPDFHSECQTSPLNVLCKFYDRCKRTDLNTKMASYVYLPFMINLRQQNPYNAFIKMI